MDSSLILQRRHLFAKDLPLFRASSKVKAFPKSLLIKKGPKQEKGMRHSFSLFGVFTLEEEGHVQTGGRRQLDKKEGCSKTTKKGHSVVFGGRNVGGSRGYALGCAYAQILFFLFLLPVVCYFGLLDYGEQTVIAIFFL